MTVRDVEAGSLELAAGAEPGGGKARLHSTGGAHRVPTLVITREAERRPAASSKGGVATRRHSKTRAALTSC